MRALQLDYQAGPRRSKASLLVLLCGLVFAMAAFMSFKDSRREAARWSSELALAQTRLDRNVRAAAPQRGDASARALEIAAANAVIRQLNLPWEGLFGALEQAAHQDVALLGIEPDAQKNRVKVTAESKTASGMINFIRRLQQAPLLGDVLLAQHELQASDPERPLRFVVTATWKNSE